MKVVEIFNSIDGEGKRAGELTTFIRLFGCNLHCLYCDTRYGCELEDANTIPYTELSIDEIINKCQQLGSNNITVTGGEPLFHTDIDYLLMALSYKGYDVNVETNGSIDVQKYLSDSAFKNVWFTIDYKCNCSGMTKHMNMNNFNNHIKNAVYKFVVGSVDDLKQAEDVINNIPVDSSNYIYLSPVFGQIEPKEIVTYMQNNLKNYNLCPLRVQLQLHKFIWPPEQRGV